MKTFLQFSETDPDCAGEGCGEAFCSRLLDPAISQVLPDLRDRRPTDHFGSAISRPNCLLVNLFQFRYPRVKALPHVPAYLLASPARLGGLNGKAGNPP